MKTPFLLMLVLIIGLCGCKREEPVTLPSVTTEPAVILSGVSATCGGKITNRGGDTVIVKGVCWSSQHLPTIKDSLTTDGSGPSDFSSFISDLTPDVRYYVRAYATNSGGTAYGEAVEMTPAGLLFSAPGTVTDASGNVYQTVQIGNQIWMKENLTTTKYNNGNPIPEIQGDNWSYTRSGAYCNIYNLSVNALDYGRLYNGYAIKDSRGIAPAGWHVATYDDWVELINYAGGMELAGTTLRETGTAHWTSPSRTATDDYGFSARGGGYREGGLPPPSFHAPKFIGRWWAAIDGKYHSGFLLFYFEVNYALTQIYTPLRRMEGINENVGMSVRCVKNK